MSTPTVPKTILYDDAFWDQSLKHRVPDRPSVLQKNHLVFSLLTYLKLPIPPFLDFLFNSDIPSVKQRAGQFVNYDGRRGEEVERFAPAGIWKAWHDRWPKSRKHLHKLIVESCAKEVALSESDNIINDTRLKLKVKELTQETFEEHLTPGSLMAIYREHAPFMWGVLEAFASSPNPYRVRKAKSKAGDKEGGSEFEYVDEDEEEGDNEQASGGDGEGAGLDQNRLSNDNSTAFLGENGVPPGFHRNPALPITLFLAMGSFARNTPTNALPTLLGLFFKIEGTSSRALQLLSNTSLTISSRSAERIKEVLSVNSIKKAVDLMHSGRLWFNLVDNINLYLKKDQQRIANRNQMLNATNTVVVGINGDGIDAEKALNLDEKLSLRGSRKDATFRDIQPEPGDGDHIRRGFEHLIAEIIVNHMPQSRLWKNRKEMLRRLDEDRPLQAPIPPQKTETWPFGVFDVDEGSKKGIIKLLEEMQKRGQFTEEEWSKKIRIISGDWLTSRNFRLARRDRADDDTPFDMLLYGQELSQLFHFALQASQMMIRTHLGNGIEDPTSLSHHKGLLGRVWDTNKPNYAAAKSLIRHSLIARIQHLVKKIKGISKWRELGLWRPDYDEICELAKTIFTKYATARAADEAQEAGDDWNTHNILFIRDALLFLYFEEGVRFADPPRILRVLRYWSLMFRGAGQHNYARECAEILVIWKYELNDDLRKVLERSWFVNRWGLPGRWIAADLYLEQLNLLVKRIYIAKGSGVTIGYIISRGSACVEAFRHISHSVAQFFGDPDRRRRSKEVAFQEDMRVLVEDMDKKDIGGVLRARLVPVSGKGSRAAKMRASGVSAITDVFVAGADIWRGKFEEWKRQTTYDPALGYVGGTESSDVHITALDNGTAFDRANSLIITCDSPIDLGLLAEEDCEGIGGGDSIDAGYTE